MELKTEEQIIEKVIKDLSPRGKALFAIVNRTNRMLYFVSPANQIFAEKAFEEKARTNAELVDFVENNW